MLFGKSRDVYGNVKKKAKKNDIIPKILSIVAAIILWFYVIDIQTTIEEKVITGIPVSIENFDTSDGLSIVSGKEHTIEVTVSGIKNEVQKISQKDIIATADMNGVESAGTHKLDINIASPKGITVINKSADYVSVSVDKTITKVRKIEVVANYNAEEDYEIGEPILSLDSVQIEGPEKVVDSVEKLRAVLELGTLKNTVKAECSLTPVDKDGNSVESPYLKLSQSSISVRIPVYKTAVVDVVPSFENDEEYDYDYKVTPERIKIKGEVSDINSIKEAKTLAISHTDETKKVYNIKLDLPVDISYCNLDGSTITSVTVDIISAKEKNHTSEHVNSDTSGKNDNEKG